MSNTMHKELEPQKNTTQSSLKTSRAQLNNMLLGASKIQ
jgi:hypothetical protein